MNRKRIMAIAVTVCMLTGLTGCAGSASAPDAPAAETSAEEAPAEEVPAAEEENAADEKTAEGEDAVTDQTVKGENATVGPAGGEGISAVLAEYPEAISDMSAEEFAESDAHWQWWDDYRTKLEASEELQDGMDGFYADILPELLAAEDQENRVCSPLNIYIALAMLAEVTDGESRRQVLDALQVKDLEELRERTSALWEANYVDIPSLKTILADSLWLRDNTAYNEETLQTLAERYYASAFHGPMGSEEMNRALREWTDENTGGLLKDFTKDLEMSPETVMALVSTIYYKAAWYDNFNEKATKKKTFHGAAGDTTVDMMHIGDTMTVYFGEHFTAVSKGLLDSGSMFFFLPDEGTDAAALAADPEVLRLIRGEWIGKEGVYTVKLSVPRFRVQAKTDLIATLEHLGIRDILNSKTADFSPLSDAVEEVFLSSAQHAAMVETDENGVTGAAYTILIAAESAALEEPEPYDFILDRPFFFAVTSRDDSILFGGVVQNIEQ